jgi:hypothetical protein
MHEHPAATVRTQIVRELTRDAERLGLAVSPEAARALASARGGAGGVAVLRLLNDRVRRSTVRHG